MRGECAHPWCPDGVVRGNARTVVPGRRARARVVCQGAVAVRPSVMAVVLVRIMWR